MKKRLTEVVVAHHHRLLERFDRATERLTRDSLSRLQRELTGHLHAEEKLVYTRLEDPALALRHGTEEHAVLAYAVERARAANGKSQLEARLRLARDLFVIHVEQEERVLLPTLELALGPAASCRLGVALDARLRRRAPL